MNNPTTLIDVADNVVKIGLGGIIAGVSAWLVARYSHQTQIAKLEAEHKNEMAKLQAEQRGAFDKMEFERKTKILTECAEFCNKLFENTVYYVVLTNRLSRADESTKVVEAKRIFARTNEFLAIANDSMRCEGSLMLLGELDCHKAIAEFFSACKEHITQSSEIIQKCSGEQITMDENHLRLLRATAMNELQKAFKRLA